MDGEMQAAQTCITLYICYSIEEGKRMLMDCSGSFSHSCVLRTSIALKQQPCRDEVACPRDCQLEKRCIIKIEWGPLAVGMVHEGKSHSHSIRLQLGSRTRAPCSRDPGSKGEGNAQLPLLTDCSFIFTWV